MISVSSTIKDVGSLEYSLLNFFDSRKDFLKKLGVYLKTITGASSKFKIDRIGSEFIVLEIYSPTHYKKGVKIVSFLGFFGLGGGIGEKIRGSVAAEDGGGRSPDRPTPPVIGGGGGGC